MWIFNYVVVNDLKQKVTPECSVEDGKGKTPNRVGVVWLHVIARIVFSTV